MLPPPARLRALTLTAAAVCSLALPARSEVLFRGDFETGDLKQWGYLLNEAGLSVVTDPVAEGTKAGKVTISKNELWSNGLNRVEVQHKPAGAYVAEGKEIYYGFSFYLPETLTTDDHQILYWETTETYQQVMQVAIQGERIHFATQDPFKVQWKAEGAATAGKWHRIVVHVKWSASADSGQVDFWFNGEHVVNALKVKTFFGHPAFVQHGILRQPTIDKVEVLYFDDARSGTTLEDVLMPAGMPGGGGAGGAGGQSMGGAATSGGDAGTPSGGSPGAGSGGAPSDGGMASSGASSAGAPNAGAASAGAPTAGAASAGAPSAPSTPPSDSGCALSPRPSGSAAGLAALAGLVGLVGLRRRRR